MNATVGYLNRHIHNEKMCVQFMQNPELLQEG